MFTTLACPYPRAGGHECGSTVGIMTDTGKLILRFRHHGEPHEVVYAFPGVVECPQVLPGRMKPQH